MEEGASVTNASHASLSQNIDTPEYAFRIGFDQRFASTTGTFEVRLDGEVVDTLEAPDSLAETMSEHVFTLAGEDEHLHGQEDISLELRLTGESGSQIIINNVELIPLAPPGVTDVEGLENIHEPGVSDQEFTVTFKSDSDIDMDTVIDDDEAIRVTGPGGFETYASFVKAQDPTDGMSREVTYTFEGPEGGWLEEHNGTYSVALSDEAVADTHGHHAEGGEFALFEVQIVAFEDDALEAAVRDELEIENDRLTPEDMRELTLLAADDAGITSLAGLEHAWNLETLSLDDNEIADLEPLRMLMDLEELHLGRNEIGDVEPLEWLTDLEILSLPANEVSDLAPIEWLNNLRNLDVTDNAISDTGPLAGMTGLERLELRSNNISDISPLAGLSNLAGSSQSPGLDVRENLLDISPNSATMAIIEDLEAQGAIVAYEPQHVVPTISQLEPEPLTGSDDLQSSTIHGSGFKGQATVALRDPSLGGTITDPDVVDQSDTQITIQSIFTANDSPWSVEVINPDGRASGEYTFQVLAETAPPDEPSGVIVWSGSFGEPPDGTFTDIAGGHTHSLAIRKDGSLAAWGSNEAGESDVPSGDDFVAIDAGASVSLALREDGSIEAWGTNTGGELNLPSGTYVAIAADSGNTAAVREDGSIVVAGTFAQTFNMLGFPSGPYTDVAVGPSGLIALHDDGHIEALSPGAGGLPGDPELEDVPPGSDFIAIAMTNAHAVALREDGTIETWGADSHWLEQSGQVPSDVSVTHAPSGDGFVQVDVGTHHGIALHEDGTATLWGMGWDPPPIEAPLAAVAAGSGHSLAIPATVSEPPGTGTVVARAIAYRDAAIAPNKQALLPGEQASEANYINAVQGLTGLTVDIADLANAGQIDVDAFTFRVGNGNDLGTWATAPAAGDVHVRQGEGANGSDRVELIWPDNTIENQWLEVTVKANDVTGLAEDDVFYVGHRTGDVTGDGRVMVEDVQLIRENQSGFGSAGIDNAYDINRTGRVDLGDVIAARNTQDTEPLELISVPTSAAPSAEPLTADASADTNPTMASATSDRLRAYTGWTSGVGGESRFDALASLERWRSTTPFLDSAFDHPNEPRQSNWDHHPSGSALFGANSLDLGLDEDEEDTILRIL